MKTPVLNTAIAIALGLIVLGVIVLPTQVERTSQPQFRPKEERKPERQAAPTAAALEPATADRITEARRDLSRLEEHRQVAERPLDVPELTQVAQAALHKLPRARAACQRIINGDGSTTTYIEEVHAYTEVSDCIREIYQKLNSVSKVRQTRGMTIGAYRSLRDGMGKMEVDQVLGCIGVEQSRADGMTVYVWQKGSANVVATFDGDKLIAKGQVGLAP